MYEMQLVGFLIINFKEFVVRKIWHEQGHSV